MRREPARKLQTRGSVNQHHAREQLIELFTSTPIPTDELLVNLPLYMRSSVVAKLLYVDELYRLIVNTPGVVIEFGVWWGANLTLFEALRAIYEPYNHTRKVIGFDTFEGYPAIGPQDGTAEYAREGGYAVTPGYLEHLSRVLDYHQQENVMSHIKKYELVKGEASVTLRRYLDAHPETIIALAYFDMQLYEPTKACLEMIQPFLTKGSVIAMDELNCWESPGETVAFKEVLGLRAFRLTRSRYLPDRTYLIVE